MNPAWPARGIYPAAVAFLLISTACNPPSGAIIPGTTTLATSRPSTQVTPLADPDHDHERDHSPTPTTAPSAGSTPKPSASPSGGSADSGLLEKGKLLFEKTAGGVGCTSCHGPEGRGQSDGGKVAPNIRGADENRVRNALQGVAEMDFIELTEDELSAVLAWLKYLGSTP